MADGGGMRDKLGICQWFHYEAYEDVERAVDLLRDLGVRHLRTGISWADHHRERGRQWHRWQLQALREFELLVSLWHTPPSIGEAPSCAAPPRRLEDFAEFVWEVIHLYGDCFEHVELWNEPNNLYKWDFARFDPEWEKFGRMVALGGDAARAMGKRTVLGGMIPVDPAWLHRMRDTGALRAMDVVAIHGFPGMWWPDAPCWDSQVDWHGWAAKLAHIAPHTEGRPVWITETGLATCDVHTGAPARHAMQARRLREAAGAPAERVYWYCLFDLHPSRHAIEGFHVDENEYHLGLCDWQGRPKPAYETMRGLLRGTETPCARPTAPHFP